MAGALALPDPLTVASGVEYFLGLIGASWQDIEALIRKAVGSENYDKIVSGGAKGLEILTTVVSAVKEKGPVGAVKELFGFLKNKAEGFSELFSIGSIVKELTGAAIEEVTKTVVGEVAKKLATVILGGPFGAAAAAVQLIWKFLTWLVTKGKELLEVVTGIFTAISKTIGLILSKSADAVAKVGDEILGVLKSLIAPAIAFVATLLGLEAIPEKIQAVVNKVRAKVTEWIGKIVNWIAKKIRRILGLPEPKGPDDDREKSPGGAAKPRVEEPVAPGAAADSVAGVEGFTKHGVNQAINRGVKPQSILDTLKNPLETKPVVIDKLGRPSQRLIGKEAEVVINPQTKKIISVNPTSTKKAARLLQQQGE